MKKTSTRRRALLVASFAALLGHSASLPLASAAAAVPVNGIAGQQQLSSSAKALLLPKAETGASAANSTAATATEETPTTPLAPYPPPDPAAAARAVGVTASGAVVLPSTLYHASVPAEAVAALAKEAVERAAARAMARGIAAAAAADATSAARGPTKIDFAAMDPRPDQRPTSAPAQVWKPLSGGVTASPMEIISKSEGQSSSPASPYGPPPANLTTAGATAAPNGASSSATTAPVGFGINGLGTGSGSGASIESENVCDRSCYNTIVPLTQGSDNRKLGGLSLGAEGASSYSSFSQQQSPERDAWRRTFVAADGRRFRVGNDSWYFGGTNQYSLTQTDWWRDDQVETAMKEHASRGAGAVRVFAFANGYGQDGYESSKMSRPFQPKIGVFSDDGLSRLDLVVASAARNGIRLILPLSNWWDEQGGCQWWVDQVYGRSPRQPKELFFTDTRVKEAFQDYIYHVITRRNPKTGGVAYSDEPAIMSWELMNEPQLGNDYDKKLGIPPGSVTTAWIREMASFVKAADGGKHLVSVGDEGWRTDVVGFGGDFGWMNDGTKGVDSATNAFLPEVDFVTVHVYAPNWGFSSDKYHWLLQNFVADRAAIAAVANKPIVLEEFGSPYGYVADRDAFLSAYTTAAAAFGYGGALIWQVFPWDTPNYQGAAFDFDYRKAGSAAVLALYDVMNTKTLFEKVVASGKKTGLIGK